MLIWLGHVIGGDADTVRMAMEINVEGKEERKTKEEIDWKNREW